MTGCERVLAALRRQEVDFVPCSPFFASLSGVQQRGYTWNFPWALPETPEAIRESYRYQVEALGVDPVVQVFLGPVHPTAAVAARVWRQGDLLHKSYTTPAGELSCIVHADAKWPFGEEIPLYSDFFAHFRKPWLRSEADLACMEYLLRPPHTSEQIDACRRRFATARALADEFRLPIMAHVGTGLTGMQQLCGAEALCLMALEKPEFIHAYVEMEHRVNLKCIELAADLGADIIRRNGFYESCDFYSPTMLRKFLARPLQEEFSRIRQAGKVSGYTLNTGVEPMLDGLAALDFDCLMHVDIAFHGHDVRALRGKLGERKSFWIGPSSAYHIWNGTEDSVRQAVRDCFNVFGKRGLILTACPSTHSIMPWDKTLAMIDEWKRLR